MKVVCGWFNTFKGSKVKNFYLMPTIFFYSVDKDYSGIAFKFMCFEYHIRLFKNNKGVKNESTI